MELPFDSMRKTSTGEDLVGNIKSWILYKVSSRFLFVIQVRMLSRLLDKCLEFRGNIWTRDRNMGVISK